MNTSGTSTRSKVIFLTIFGIAMGFLEAVVVVYLRQIYYPEGFAFPLKPMAIEAFSFEILREISTIIMLISMGMMAGKNFSERFAYILYCFGIWDSFYYVWLKVLLNWPPSFLTWDILFLIPVIWTGPVLAPIICAVTMIMIAGCILYFLWKGIHIKLNLSEWLLFFLGALAIFSTFVWEYSRIIIQGGFLSRFLSLGTDPDFQKIVAKHVPISYNWHFFIIGEILVLCFLVLFYRRMKISL